MGMATFPNAYKKGKKTVHYTYYDVLLTWVMKEFNTVPSLWLGIYSPLILKVITYFVIL